MPTDRLEIVGFVALDHKVCVCEAISVELLASCETNPPKVFRLCVIQAALLVEEAPA